MHRHSFRVPQGPPGLGELAGQVLAASETASGKDCGGPGSCLTYGAESRFYMEDVGFEGPG